MKLNAKLLAANGLRMPIGTDLILHESGDPDSVRLDASAFSRVLEKSASEFNTPFAITMMDLQLEKGFLADLMGVDVASADTFHISGALSEAEEKELLGKIRAEPFSRLMSVNCEALGMVAARRPDLIVCGMSIGPFSLATKLMEDPITPVFMAGMGMSGEDEPGVAVLEQCMRLSKAIVFRYVEEQVMAGADVVIVAEPSANRVYISPKQMEEGSDVFQRLVVGPNEELRNLITGKGAQLFLHDCGDMEDEMLRQFAAIRPSILSLGSFRSLWEAARVVPEDVVLFGNLPSKRFFSAAEMPEEKVEEMSREIVRKMAEIGRPFILGTECDVLDVREYREEILRKVRAMLRA